MGILGSTSLKLQETRVIRAIIIGKPLNMHNLYNDPSGLHIMKEKNSIKDSDVHRELL